MYYLKMKPVVSYVNLTQTNLLSVIDGLLQFILSYLMRREMFVEVDWLRFIGGVFKADNVP